MILMITSYQTFAKYGRKLKSVENKIRDIFIQGFVFNKTIIPLALVGYELMIADSVLRTLDELRTSSAIISSLIQQAWEEKLFY